MEMAPVSSDMTDMDRRFTKILKLRSSQSDHWHEMVRVTGVDPNRINAFNRGQLG